MKKEESMYCDLHTHSTFSDGTDTPAELIKKAEQAGLAAVALTDHNSIFGLPEFLEAAKDSEVIAVPGAEFSTEYDGREYHVVGLFIKEEHYEKVREYCEPVRNAKEYSNRLLISNLKNAGYDVDYDEMMACAGKKNVNRVAIADYLVKKGILKDISEGFDTLLSPDGGYYVPSKRPSTLETIRFIKSIGAVAVLAHPLHKLPEEEETKVQTVIKEGKKCGLDAIETDYSTYDECKQKQAKNLAWDNGLLFSGGSDYHGEGKKSINLGVGKGDLKVPMEYYVKLAERANG